MRLKFGEIKKSLYYISVDHLKIPSYFHVFNDSLEGEDIIYEEIIIYAHFHYWSLLLFNCMIQYAIMQ
jgi:hypothetical protein